jgi:hypothetical protein
MSIAAVAALQLVFAKRTKLLTAADRSAISAAVVSSLRLPAASLLHRSLNPFCSSS